MNFHRWTTGLACAAALLFSLTSQGQQFTLAWSPSPTPAVNYRLYAHTNSSYLTNLSLATVKLDAGTNLTATVRDLSGGAWRFVATAYVSSLESVPSNELIVNVPSPPANLGTVVLQFNASVTGTNWLDAGFFRIKFGP
jgi:hypothetical protein